MSWTFSTERAAQAAAVILKAAPGHQMDYRRLMTLLYIADRESIRETGAPITGDNYHWEEKGCQDLG